jgi:hypothetical protein
MFFYNFGTLLHCISFQVFFFFLQLNWQIVVILRSLRSLVTCLEKMNKQNKYFYRIVSQYKMVVLGLSFPRYKLAFFNWWFLEVKWYQCLAVFLPSCPESFHVVLRNVTPQCKAEVKAKYWRSREWSSDCAVTGNSSLWKRSCIVQMAGRGSRATEWMH